MVLGRYRKIIIFLILAIVVTVGILVLNSEKSVTEEKIQEMPQETTEEKGEKENLNSIQNEPFVQTTTTSGAQLYRNEEFGFEFEYSEEWTLYVISDPFRGTRSRFQIMGAPAEKEYLIYRPNPPFLINIVTPDFADNAVISRQNFGAIESDIVVGNVHGVKYEYTAELFQKIAVDIPFGEYRLILAVNANKEYEDVLNQILSSFKFIEPQ